MSLDVGFSLEVDPAKVIFSLPFVLSQMIGRPSLAFSWETDPECLLAAGKRVPSVQQRGDLFVDDMKEIARLIHQHDPSGSCVVLLTGGPPCHDYRVIKQVSDGREGVEGPKFVKFADSMETLEASLPNHRVAPLIENVLMSNNDDILYLSDRLKSQPILVDSADRGAVSRPRLWWSRINWTSVRTNPG